MKALIYVRVSTNRQSEKGYSLESQEAKLIPEAERLGYEVEVISETKSGTSTANRKKLKEALDQLKQGKAQALFVLDMDRLGRSAIDIMRIGELAIKQKWVLWIANIGGDIAATPSAKLTFGILAQVAEMESNLISERVKRQHEARRERGVIWGVHEGCKSFLEEDVRKLILKYRKQGFTYAAIARKLTNKKIPTATGKLWHSSTIRHILISPQTRQLEKKAA
ncbi:MAG: recombinase family protein [Actinobacteria bacterium]|nr:recombinase family protein [Actinomycetota bacterium]